MGELLDIVDEQDNVVGQHDRDSIYQQGWKNFRCVNIFLANSNGELLIPTRSADRSIFPNCIDFSCGEHVMSGEKYGDGAIRGLQEELGIDVSPDQLIVL